MDNLAAQRAVLHDLKRFAFDPLGFVRYWYPWGEGELEKYPDGPNGWQTEQLEYVGERLRAGHASTHDVIECAIASGHDVGKSANASWLIHWAMRTCDGTRGVVTANTDTQLRTKTWPEVAKWHRLGLDQRLGFNWFRLEATGLFSTIPKLKKDWRIDIVPWSEKNTEAFQGLHNLGKRVLVVFDEASAIPDKIWEVTEGALMDEDTQIIWVQYGNPTRASGRFRSCFAPHKPKGYRRHVDSREVPHTNKAFIDRKIEEHGEDSDYVKVRIKGQFPSLSTRQLISEKDADAANNRHLFPEQYDFAPKILTLDNAWEGDDECVFGFRQGLHYRTLDRLPKNDNDMVIGAKLARYEDELGADAVFIDLGYGTGVVSYGRTIGRDWVLVNFGEKSPDEGCINMRAYMYDQARKWLKEGGSFQTKDGMADEDMKAQLVALETIPRRDGKLQMEDKDDLKKRIGCSPDVADALVLSFAHPVQSKKHRPTARPARARTANQPFGSGNRMMGVMLEAVENLRSSWHVVLSRVARACGWPSPAGGVHGPGPTPTATSALPPTWPDGVGGACAQSGIDPSPAREGAREGARRGEVRGHPVHPSRREAGVQHQGAGDPRRRCGAGCTHRRGEGQRGPAAPLRHARAARLRHRRGALRGHPGVRHHPWRVGGNVDG